MKKSLTLIVLVVALVVSACSGDDISASTCDEVVDETMELFQRLIDDVDEEFGELTVADFLASQGELPSIETFEEDAATIEHELSDVAHVVTRTLVAFDDELHGWLTAEAAPELVFGDSMEGKWEAAVRSLGIHPLMLSAEAGHA